MLCDTINKNSAKRIKVLILKDIYIFLAENRQAAGSCSLPAGSCSLPAGSCSSKKLGGYWKNGGFV